MAKTQTHLYRSVMEARFSIKLGEYPGDGVLDPRWQPKSYLDKKGITRLSKADVVVMAGAEGPEVEIGGGTSLHDVPRWYPYADFWIPTGTEYSEAEIHLRRDDDKRTSKYNPRLSGFHYQLQPKYRMAVVAFQGALNNMARAAVVCQIALSTGKHVSKV